MIKQKISQHYQHFLSVLSAHKYAALFISIIGILVDIFIFSFTSDLVILILTVVWIGAVIGWRLEGRFSIAAALIFLAMCPLLLILKKRAIAEKAAIWAYMFLVVGFVQQLIELKKKPNRLVDFDRFIRTFRRGLIKAKESLREPEEIEY